MKPDPLNPRPLWRWWLWCIAFDLWYRTRWGWLGDFHAWLILPEWLGYEPGDGDDKGEVPF